MTAERIWIMVAGILVVIAAVFLWRNNFSAAFVAAVLGGCAWFLSYRSQLRAKNVALEDQIAEEQTYEDDED